MVGEIRIIRMRGIAQTHVSALHAWQSVLSQGSLADLLGRGQPPLLSSTWLVVEVPAARFSPCRGVSSAYPYLTGIWGMHRAFGASECSGKQPNP